MKRLILAGGFLILLAAPLLFAADVKILIQAAPWELRPGLVTSAWTYNGRVPGIPIVAAMGDTLIIDVTNQLPVKTNIHWHGLEVPNNQDGPAIEIAPGGRYRYQFTVRDSGTYWYHSHSFPVLSQLDRGLYGAFIVKAPEDDRYSGDHLLVLDDWYLDARGKRLDGTDRGDMERFGNVETVNGKTADAVEPLVVQSGELHKLRFINASTAAVHTLRITGHQFRITHTDGHPLVQPYVTDVITLVPGERLDAELSATGAPGSSALIMSDRPELGIRIPVAYKTGTRSAVTSPFVPPASRAFPRIKERVPDAVLELNSMMGMMSGGMGGMHDMHGMSASGDGASSMIQWTINGRAFPDTDPVFAAVGEVVKIRFRNSDTMMMHPMDHAMHVHGASFQVVSLNGQDPPRETWKDTINVPAGQFVDIAILFRNPGQWMLHCHIIDHEDGGMMTMVEVR
jgi:FtsP/CotA-like multicopper oxidase with cupredoxin domain